MARVTDLTVDDAYDLWVCPIHGVISEDELLEGHDGTMFGSTPDGDPYTGRFYCARDHEGQSGGPHHPEAHVVNVREDVEAALQEALCP